MRIDRVLANAGYGTRTQIKDMIKCGRVSFKDVPVYDPAFFVSEQTKQHISLDGKSIIANKFLYLLLHKPAEYLTALEDKRLKTIADLIPSEYIAKGLAPVGRLDYHTTGLLLLTNNGTLSHRLTSPKWHIPKTYLVTYSGIPLTEEEVQLFADCMTLHELGKEPVHLASAQLVLLHEGQCLLTLTEGKTHQVKRMIAAVNRSVTALHREKIGGISLNNHPVMGECRHLTSEEIETLFQETGLTGSTH